ncbi:MAG: pitrilysin family protein [Patescibacteria group bacterium]
MKSSGGNFEALMTDHGVPVYLMPRGESETLALGVLVKTGTRDEEWPREAGLAHALEHMFFQGTKHFPETKDFSAQIENTGGIINAWTTKEMTFYWRQVPAAAAEVAVTSLAEQLHRPLFREDKIRTEMQNIVQELRRRNDDPVQNLNDHTYRYLYAGHPLEKDTLGLEESITNFQYQNFVDFHRRFYHPGRQAIIAAGKITGGELLALLNRHFTEKPDPVGPRETRSILEAPVAKELVIEKEIEQVHLNLVAIGPKAKDPAAKALDLFKMMLSAGMSFPLFQEVRDKLGLCYTIKARCESWSDAGAFGIYVGTDPKRYREAIKVIERVVGESASDAALLARTKETVLGRLAIAFESTTKIIETAAIQTALLDRPQGYDEVKAEVDAITIEDIKEAVNQYLKPDQFRLVRLTPKTKN